jgi:hypothetical protein
MKTIQFDRSIFNPIIIPDNVARGFVIEAASIDNDTQAGGKDMFGVQWEWVPQVMGSMVRDTLPPLVPDLREWEKYVIFPNLDDYDWEGSAQGNASFFKADREYIIWVMNGLFERLISFVGFENAAIALIDDDVKPHVQRLFDRLCDFYEDLIGRYKKYYPVSAIFFHDDWGGQRSPFFSVDTVREMLLPHLKRLVAYTHSLGLLFDFHSCGKIEVFVPLMIEAGVDIWSGQEINDKPAVIREHRGKILVKAGPKNLAFGSNPEEAVRAATEDFVRKYDGLWDGIVVMDHTDGELFSKMLREAVSS